MNVYEEYALSHEHLGVCCVTWTFVRSMLCHMNICEEYDLSHEDL